MLSYSDASLRGTNVHPTELSHEQSQLWTRCEELWKLSTTRETFPVRAALHPDYTEWVTGTERPHDRDAAVASVDRDRR